MYPYVSYITLYPPFNAFELGKQPSKGAEDMDSSIEQTPNPEPSIAASHFGKLVNAGKTESFRTAALTESSLL